MSEKHKRSLPEALVAAQMNFEAAYKSSSNPHFRSKYASLDVCVDAVRDALNEQGIFLMQVTHPCDDGVTVETVFLHESGERLSGGCLTVPAAKHDAQGYGSALTYARRYSLLAACGVAPEDDDGNAATASTRSPTVVTSSQINKRLTEAQALIDAADSVVAIKEIITPHLKWAKEHALHTMHDALIERGKLRAESLKTQSENEAN